MKRSAKLILEKEKTGVNLKQCVKKVYSKQVDQSFVLFAKLKMI